MTEEKGQKGCRSSLVPAFRPKILKMRDYLVNNGTKTWLFRIKRLPLQTTFYRHSKHLRSVQEILETL